MITPELAELLFAVEAALPFVQAHVGSKTCSSSGGPAALRALLAKYEWDNNRIQFLKNMNTDAEVIREPLDLDKVKQEIDDVFVFQRPISEANLLSCQKVQNACRELAKIICEEVPEGKEQTIAINNLLSTALFASHGIKRRQVLIMGVAADPT